MEDIDFHRGNILISEPFLPDPNFMRSVILLCEHNDDGSIGFVLNKPTRIDIEELIEEISNYDRPVYAGGPVEQDTLHYIHRLEDQLEGSTKISEGLFWGGNFEQLKILINNNQVNPEDFRFFLGYSGWAEGQLIDEYKAHSWIVSSVTSSQIFDMDPNELWKNVLKNMGGKYKVMSNYPIDPRLN